MKKLKLTALIGTVSIVALAPIATTISCSSDESSKIKISNEFKNTYQDLYNKGCFYTNGNSSNYDNKLIEKFYSNNNNLSTSNNNNVLAESKKYIDDLFNLNTNNNEDSSKSKLLNLLKWSFIKGSTVELETNNQMVNFFNNLPQEINNSINMKANRMKANRSITYDVDNLDIDYNNKTFSFTFKEFLNNELFFNNNERYFHVSVSFEYRLNNVKFVPYVYEYDYYPTILCPALLLAPTENTNLKLVNLNMDTPNVDDTFNKLIFYMQSNSLISNEQLNILKLYINEYKKQYFVQIQMVNNQFKLIKNLSNQNKLGRNENGIFEIVNDTYFNLRYPIFSGDLGFKYYGSQIMPDSIKLRSPIFITKDNVRVEDFVNDYSYNNNPWIKYRI